MAFEMLVVMKHRPSSSVLLPSRCVLEGRKHHPRVPCLMPVELESMHPPPAEASAVCSRRTQATFHRSVSRCTILREPTRSWPRLSHLHGAREEREQFIGLSHRRRSLEKDASNYQSPAMQRSRHVLSLGRPIRASCSWLLANPAPDL